MSKVLNSLMRIAAYGAMPAFLYLAMVMYAGGGAPEMIFPALFVLFSFGYMISCWVEGRKKKRDK